MLSQPAALCAFNFLLLYSSQSLRSVHTHRARTTAPMTTVSTHTSLPHCPSATSIHPFIHPLRQRSTLPGPLSLLDEFPHTQPSPSTIPQQHTAPPVHPQPSGGHNEGSHTGTPPYRAAARVQQTGLTIEPAAELDTVRSENMIVSRCAVACTVTLCGCCLAISVFFPSIVYLPLGALLCCCSCSSGARVSCWSPYRRSACWMDITPCKNRRVVQPADGAGYEAMSSKGLHPSFQQCRPCI